jgi:tetrahydromethanopterin S-methyltransferase subunit D
VSGREEPESYAHADVAVGEVLVPCSCDFVAVGGALKTCRSTAVGAVGTLLTSPCFRRELRTAVVMEHARCHHYLFDRGEPDGTPVLFPIT